jgi:cardiolipin synthase
VTRREAREVVAWALIASLAGLGVLSAGHALLHKRDPRAGLGWIVACLAIPGVGALLYWTFGVNRIRTRARKYQNRWHDLMQGRWGSATGAPHWAVAHALIPEAYAPLIRAAATVTRRPLLPGNRVTPLFTGTETYRAMLAAIGAARESVHLSSYIFNADEAGRAFIDALAASAGRGVDVKVLIDGFGQFYTFNRTWRLLRHRGVRAARFLPFTLTSPRFHFNLRNHRKILVVDRALAFTGGMNISREHLPAPGRPHDRVTDIHFRVEGPVVLQMEEAFREDWSFASGQVFEPVEPPQSMELTPAVCRGVSAGPNEDFEKLQWIVLGALHAARRRIRIMTPYFVPSRELLSALTGAVLRGVEVDIVLPGAPDHRVVQWASRAMLWEVLLHGVRVFYRPAPFAHSKLLIVDDHYVLLGSANLDPRSMRLNFEFDLEVYDGELGALLARHVDEARAASREVDFAEVEGRSLPVRLRDASARLLAPYL